MPSVIAWLDVSAAEQQRARELLALNGNPRTQDDLGIGALRDAIADALFPGTSTLFTRARYLVLTPWSFERAAHARDPRKALDEIERRQIVTLLRAGAVDGLIGRDAGRHVKTLPSTIYWTALGRWGIRADARASVAETLARSAHATIEQADGEPRRIDKIWNALPVPPAFPSEVEHGLDLTADEASWLRERILDTCQGTALAHFVEHRDCVAADAPWPAEPCESMPAAPAALLGDARAFSALIHGAQLLYHRMLADRMVEDTDGNPNAAGWSDDRGRDLDAWLSQWRRLASDWNLEEMLQRLAAKPTPAMRRAQTFSRLWFDHASHMLDADDWRGTAPAMAIQMQERHVKRSLARLHNPKRLHAWDGASRPGRLLFRWPQVRVLLRDIHEGLDA